MEIASSDPKAPETMESRGKERSKILQRELAQLNLLPLLILQTKMEGRRESARRT
jgi:hypothetical protein